MESSPSITERLKAGEEVEVDEIVARFDELEAKFDDQGFLYIAVNDWLLSSLESVQEARELMFLRAIRERLDEFPGGTVVLSDKENDNAGELVCSLGGRYMPDGYLYSVPSRDVEAAATSNWRVHGAIGDYTVWHDGKVFQMTDGEEPANESGYKDLEALLRLKNQDPRDFFPVTTGYGA